MQRNRDADSARARDSRAAVTPRPALEPVPNSVSRTAATAASGVLLLATSSAVAATVGTSRGLRPDTSAPGSQRHEAVHFGRDAIDRRRIERQHPQRPLRPPARSWSHGAEATMITASSVPAAPASASPGPPGDPRRRRPPARAPAALQRGVAGAGARHPERHAPTARPRLSRIPPSRRTTTCTGSGNRLATARRCRSGPTAPNTPAP